MIIRIRLPLVIGTGITLLILILVFGSMALAQEIGGQVIREGQASPSIDPTPVPGGPGFVALNSYAFHPFYPGDQYNRWGQLLYCWQTSCQFAAGITLPHGATITKFVAYYYDNSDNDMHAALMRGPLYAEFPIIVADIYTQGKGITNRTSETTTFDSPVVDDQTNSYYVLVEFAGTDDLIHFIGVRVDYDYPVQLPLIQK